MPKHEFGIMKNAPKQHERFDVYAPEKYDCISINDAYIEPLLEKFSQLPCFWHTLERPEKNLAYYGITLIPPSSLNMLLDILEGADGTEELKKLLMEAEKENQFVIHFGI